MALPQGFSLKALLENPELLNPPKINGKFVKFLMQISSLKTEMLSIIKQIAGTRLLYFVSCTNVRQDTPRYVQMFYCYHCLKLKQIFEELLVYSYEP